MVLNFLDGSIVTISLLLNERKQSDLNNILHGILDAWKEYFPSYDFCGEAILVEGDDTLQLLAPEKPCGIPDIDVAVKQSSSYVCKFFQKKCSATEILECFACKEHKFLKFPNAVSYSSDDASNSAICPLLAPSFFTVLDLGHMEMDDDFIHFCSIGLRTNKALRSLVFRESQIDSEKLSSLLRSLPSSSKLRKLDIASKGVELSKVFGDLKPKIYLQLIDLRIDAGKIDNSTFMKTIAHIESMSSEKLPLRRIILSETCIRSSICSALSSSKCTLLEFLSLADNKFTKPDIVIKNYFASLRFLQRLSLKGTSGETASDVLKTTSRQLGVRDDEKMCRDSSAFILLQLVNGQRPLATTIELSEDERIEMIFKGLHSVENPVYNRLSVDLDDCKLDIKAAEVIAKYMPKVEHLTKILLHKNAFEDKVIDIIKCLPKCPRLTHISLGHKGRPVATGILKKLTETLLLPECKVEKLTLGPLGSNKELCEFLKTLANLGKKLAYLNIADYTLKDNDSKYISGLIQWADSKTPFTLIFNSSNFSDSPNFGVKRLTEVDKFIDAIITPSPELCDVDLELTGLAIRLQQKMSTTNVEKLESHYPKIHQAKIALQGCSTLPSMHVELLDAALDPVECNRAVNQAMSDIRAVLQLLDANVKVAEEMLCRVTTGLKDDIETCLNDFPDQTKLRLTKPAIDSENEYASVSIPLIWMHTLDFESVILTPDQAFSGTLLPASHARPMRRKTHTVTTIIHTLDSEVVHGPVDTVDLFPTSNPPPKEDGNGSLGSSDVQPPTPMKSPIRSPLIKAAIPGMNNDVLLNAIKKRDPSLQKSPITPPSPPAMSYTVSSEANSRESFAALRQRFEDGNQIGRAAKSMYQPRSK
ncbi:hypothetical protein TSMEX_003733, partial [Taenia solium]